MQGTGTRLPVVAAAAAAVVLCLPTSLSGPPAPRTVVSPAVTVSGNAAYSVQTTRTGDGRVLVLRWNPCQAAVTYKVNTALAGASSAARAGAMADVDEAFDRLGAATGIRFVDLGSTSDVPSGPRWSDHTDGAEIVVSWVDQSRATSTLLGRSGGSWVAATGGYAYRTWSTGGPWSGAIGRGFVVINTRQQGSFAAGFGRGVTRGNLVLHELGHVMGLGHVTDTAQLMYPVILSRAGSGYRSGDRSGLAKVGRAAGCIAVPDFAWPSS